MIPIHDARINILDVIQALKTASIMRDIRLSKFHRAPCHLPNFTAVTVECHRVEDGAKKQPASGRCRLRAMGSDPGFKGVGGPEYAGNIKRDSTLHLPAFLRTK